MEIALFIQNIQEERAEVALFIFTNQSTAATAAQREKNRMGIQERFKQTDQALEDVPTWPNVSIRCPDELQNQLLKFVYKIDQSVTAQKILPVGTIGADGSEAFRSKLKFQIQHEVFRYVSKDIVVQSGQDPVKSQSSRGKDC